MLSLQKKKGAKMSRDEIKALALELFETSMFHHPADLSDYGDMSDDEINKARYLVLTDYVGRYPHVFKEPIASHELNERDKIWNEWQKIMPKIHAKLCEGLNLPNAEFWSEFFEKYDSVDDFDERYNLFDELFKDYELEKYYERGELLLSELESVIFDYYWDLKEKDEEEIEAWFEAEESAIEEQNRLEYEDFLERKQHNPNLQA